MRCFETFEVDPIVPFYGLLWYMNSIYGIVLMMVESNNVCFLQWCPVCIVNITVPLLWLLIITMVDSCCIKYWSLNRWNRRHYGAAFLYFAIFTNQLLIFGFLCFYGFTVWSTIATATCNASTHLYYGFIVLLSISTALIVWIGFYQFYAATKYLCTYHAVLDVKRRQLNSNRMRARNNKNNKTNKTKHGRKYSLESNSANASTMSLTFIGSIFRYGSEDHSQDDIQSIDDTDIEHVRPLPLQTTSSLVEPHPSITQPHVPPPTLNLHHCNAMVAPISPLPSLNLRNMSSETEELQLMDSYETDGHEHEDMEAKELSHHSSSSETEYSPSAFNIEIAGIVIPTKKFTKKGYRKRHRHKSYKAVANATPNPHEEEEEDDEEEDDTYEGMIEIKQINNEKEEKEMEKEKRNAKKEAQERLDGAPQHRKKHLFSVPLVGKAILIMSHYFERLKEDPSTTDLCIICYDSFHTGDYLARLKCGHVYHKNCIRIWMANNRHCPLCDMDEKNINLKFKIFA